MSNLWFQIPLGIVVAIGGILVLDALTGDPLLIDAVLHREAPTDTAWRTPLKHKLKIALVGLGLAGVASLGLWLSRIL